MENEQTMSIVTIPREVQVIIFSQLKQSDLVRVSETCHRLKDAALDPSLWKKLTMSYEQIKSNNKACRNKVSQCPSLREIFITGEEEVIRSDKIMAVLVKAKDTLTSINLSPSFAGLSWSSFQRIRAMTKLTHLALGGEKLRPMDISAFERLTELRSLKVSGIKCGGGSFISNEPVETILYTRHILAANTARRLVLLFSTLKKLEEVEIRMIRNYPSDRVVETLVNNNPSLHHLDISSSTPNPIPIARNNRSLIILAEKCPQLTYIGIGNLTVFSSTNIIKLVTNCPKLKHANFERTNVNDTALAIMSEKCPDLEYIKISNCRMITQEGLETFVYQAYAANLKCLDISDDFEFQMIFSTHFLKRLKQDLPNLKINSEADEDDHDDSSYDSDSDEDYYTNPILLALGHYDYYDSSSDDDCCLM